MRSLKGATANRASARCPRPPACSKVLAVALIALACLVCAVLVLRTTAGILRLKVGSVVWSPLDRGACKPVPGAPAACVPSGACPPVAAAHLPGRHPHPLRRCSSRSTSGAP